MRNKEFLNNDPALFDEVATRCLEGYLALDGGEGYPRAVAINFAAQDGRIYFHGALAGDKFKRLAANGRVGFTMVLPYSLTPSYWATSDGSACPATQLYISIEVCGLCCLVEDRVEKASGLQSIMEKYQPEGNHRPIDNEDPRYERSITGVGVFRVEVESWSGKVRMGQNLPEKSRRNLVNHLRKRGSKLDQKTADWIAATFET
ncbi:MAG: pyridoxamine 5'-phosphate oxidase family protein [Gemmatimonadales bacterium]|nr:pyridoxamine 5'-phosphate oxidase family protein [Gemmatimonadales bacterium]